MGFGLYEIFRFTKDDDMDLYLIRPARSRLAFGKYTLFCVGCDEEVDFRGEGLVVYKKKIADHVRFAPLHQLVSYNECK